MHIQYSLEAHGGGGGSVIGGLAFKTHKHSKARPWVCVEQEDRTHALYTYLSSFINI